MRRCFTKVPSGDPESDMSHASRDRRFRADNSSRLSRWGSSLQVPNTGKVTRWQEAHGGTVKLLRISACIAAAVLGVGGLTVATSPMAAADSLQTTVHCDGDVTVYGSPGDRLTFTMGSGCTSAYYLMNLSPAFPNHTGAGFLDYISGGTFFVPWAFFGAQTPADWRAYSDGSGTTSIATTLLATSGQGTALEVGSTLGDIGTNVSHVDFAIVYGGPIPPGRDLTIWHQAVPRPGLDGECSSGWAPSWEQWSNGGAGGSVCVKDVYAYYPDEPVR
jgi:hypothetical protein